MPRTTYSSRQSLSGLADVRERMRAAAFNRAVNDPDPVRRANSAAIMGVELPEQTAQREQAKEAQRQAVEQEKRTLAAVREQQKEQARQQKEAETQRKAQEKEAFDTEKNKREQEYRRDRRPNYVDAKGMIQPVDDDETWTKKKAERDAREAKKLADANYSAQEKKRVASEKNAQRIETLEAEQAKADATTRFQAAKTDAEKKAAQAESDAAHQRISATKARHDAAELERLRVKEGVARPVSTIGGLRQQEEQRAAEPQIPTNDPYYAGPDRAPVNPVEDLTRRAQDFQTRQQAHQQQVATARQPLDTVINTIRARGIEPLRQREDGLQEFDPSLTEEEKSQIRQAHAHAKQAEEKIADQTAQIEQEGTALQKEVSDFETKRKADEEASYARMSQRVGAKPFVDRVKVLDADFQKIVQGLPDDASKQAALEKYQQQRQALLAEGQANHDQIMKEFFDVEKLYQDEVAKIQQDDSTGKEDSLSSLEINDKLDVDALAEKYGMSREQAQGMRQDAANLSRPWQDLINKQEKSRLLSDGRVLVNPRFWVDEKAYTDAVNSSGATEEGKKESLAMLPALKREAASNLLNSLAKSESLAELVNSLKGKTDEEKVDELLKMRRDNAFLKAVGARLNASAESMAGGVMGIISAATGNDWAAESMQRWNERSSAHEALAGTSGLGPIADFLTKIPAGAQSIVPALAGGAGAQALGRLAGLSEAGVTAAGLAGSAATAGLQSAGGTFGQAFDAALAQNGQDFDKARIDALKPSIISGLITAAATYAGGAKGVESVFREPAGKAMVKQALWRAIAGSGIRGLKEGLEETLEEGVDTLAQGILERLTFNPSKGLSDIINETLEAGALGFALGGGVSTGNDAVSALNPESKAIADVGNLSASDSELAAYAPEITGDPATDALAEIAPDRARVLRDIATGRALEDLENRELSAIGLQRQPSGEIKPAKGKDAIAPAVSVENGQPIILQEALDELEQTFPQTRALIGMSEREARARISQPTADESGTESGKPAVTDSGASAATSPTVQAGTGAANAPGSGSNGKKLLSQEERIREGRKILADLGESSQRHDSRSAGDSLVDGTFNGDFRGAGSSTLEVDEDGNVVLRRFAHDGNHMTKSGQASSGPRDLMDTSEFHGGGNGVPTIGSSRSTAGVSQNSYSDYESEGVFRIPAEDFQRLAEAGEIMLGNIGETEVVISPAVASTYLSETIDRKTGKVSKKEAANDKTVSGQPAFVSTPPASAKPADPNRGSNAQPSGGSGVESTDLPSQGSAGGVEPLGGAPAQVATPVAGIPTSGKTLVAGNPATTQPKPVTPKEHVLATAKAMIEKAKDKVAGYKVLTRARLVAEAVDRVAGNFAGVVFDPESKAPVSIDANTGELIVNVERAVARMNEKSVKDATKWLERALDEEFRHRVAVDLEQSSEAFANDLKAWFDALSPELKEQSRAAYFAQSKNPDQQFASEFEARHEAFRQYWSNEKFAGLVEAALNNKGALASIRKLIAQFIKELRRLSKGANPQVKAIADRLIAQAEAKAAYLKGEGVRTDAPKKAVVAKSATAEPILSTPPSSIDAASVSAMLDGTYEPDQSDRQAAEAFELAIAEDDGLRQSFGGRIPMVAVQSREHSRSQRLGAAIIAQLSGKRLVFYTPRGSKAPGGINPGATPDVIGVDARASSEAHLKAGHEMWHWLQREHPETIQRLGRLIEESINPLALESASQEFTKNYGGGVDALHEVAANIFGNAVTEPLFWRSGKHANKKIAAALESLEEKPTYSQSRLISDWPAFVKEVSRIVDSRKPSSRVTPEQDAEYFRAFLRGDEAMMQRMVDDAAKAAGVEEKQEAVERDGESIVRLSARFNPNATNRLYTAPDDSAEDEEALRRLSEQAEEPQPTEEEERALAEFYAEVAEIEQRMGLPAAPVAPSPRQTSLKNSVVDKERVARGLQPIQGPIVRSWGEVGEAAARLLNANPQAGYDIIRQVKNNPRTLSDEESAVVLLHKAAVRHKLHKLSETVNSTPRDSEANKKAKEDYDHELEELNSIDIFSRAVGTEAGRSLAIRKLMMDEDSSPESLMQKYRTEVNLGEPLSDEQRAIVTKHAEAIQKKEKELSDIAAEPEIKATTEALHRLIDDLKKEVAELKGKLESGKPSGGTKAAQTKRNPVSKFIYDNAKDAMKKVAGLFGKKLNTAPTLETAPEDLTAENLADLATVGAAYIEDGASDLEQFTKALVADLGEDAVPFAERIYNEAKKVHAQAQADLEASQRPDGVLKRAKSRLGELPKGDLDKRLMTDLARAYIRQGVSETEDIVTRITKDIQAIYPDATEANVRTVLSGYGKTSEPMKDEVERRLSEVKAESRLIQSLKDAQGGKAPLKTGYQRGPVPEKQRSLWRQVIDAMKRAGIKTTGPEQLADARKAIVTRLNNQIEDLTAIIEGRSKPRAEKDVVKYDEEMNALVKERDALKEYVDDLTGPSPELKWNRRAQAAAKASEEHYRRRIAKNDLENKKPSPQPESAETKRLRSEAQAAKDEWEALREASGIPQRELLDRARTKLKERIAEYDRQIQEGFQPPKGKKPLGNPELQALRETRNHLRKALLNTEGGKKWTDEKRAQAATASVEKSIADLKRRIDEKDTSAKSKAAPVEDSPELKALKQEQAFLREIYASVKEAQNPRRLPEEIALDQFKKLLAKKRYDLEHDIREKKYLEVPKPDPLFQKRIDTAKYELDKAKREWMLEMFTARQAKRDTSEKVTDTIGELMAVQRAIMTSQDLSAVRRQGGFLTASHPITASKSLIPMMQALFSEKKAHAVMEEIKRRKNYPLYKQAGLYLTEEDETDLTKMEENYQSRWAKGIKGIKGAIVGGVVGALRGGISTVGAGGIGAIPGAAIGATLGAIGSVDGSQRAFVTFLNKLRADVFDLLLETNFRDGRATVDDGRVISNFINLATGRGHIGFVKRDPLTNKLTEPQTGRALSNFLFAPKWLASRVNMMLMQPLIGKHMKAIRDPQQRRAMQKLVAKEYGKFLIGQAAIFALLRLAYMAYDDKDDKDREKKPFIVTDPRSSDFLKVRFGNSRVDFFGGMLQPLVFLAREMAGEISSKGEVRSLRNYDKPLDLLREAGLMDEPSAPDLKFGQEDGAGLAFRFLRSKMAPIPGMLMNIMASRDFSGKPTTAFREAIKSFEPMSAGGIADAIADQGVTWGTALAIVGLLGDSVQTYNEFEAREKELQPLEFRAMPKAAEKGTSGIPDKPKMPAMPKMPRPIEPPKPKTVETQTRPKSLEEVRRRMRAVA